MLNFVLCDDNETILNKLDSMLDSLFLKHDFDAQIGFKSDNAESILSYIKSNRVDVLILDINLKSKMTGIELAEQVRKTNKSVYIIFTTGHLEYALIAYKVKTFDYIPKPLTVERLEDTVLRLYNDMSNNPKKYLVLNNRNIISQKEIEYIRKDGMKSIIYTDAKEYETYASFTKIMDCLPDNFVRCHKSYIANVDNIKNVESTDNLIEFDHSECYIGPKYKNNFMEVLNNYGNFTDTMVKYNNI